MRIVAAMQLWYAGVLACSAVVCTAVGYAVYVKLDGHDRGAFTVYIGTTTLMVVFAAAGVLAARDRPSRVLALAQQFATLGTVVALWHFATVYTNRPASPRRPRNAAVVLWAAVSAAAIGAQPIIGGYYAEIVHRPEPFPHVTLDQGPLYLFAAGGAYVVIGISLSYLATLFIKSQHRSYTSMLLLVVATVAALLPNLVSMFGAVPMLPGFDHTPFGATPFTVVLAYVLFWRGELDLAPVARAEVVDQIDDALFGLDEQRRLVDYNAAGAALLAADVDDPIGDRLEEVAPGVAARLCFPEGPGVDETTTLTTVVDGSRAYYSVVVSPIVEREAIAGYTVILRDVTERESYRRELERQNDQLEDVAETISEDLRTPIRTAETDARVLIETVRSQDDDAEPVVGPLADVAASIERMDAIISDLRTLTKHGRTVESTSSVAFARVVEEAWSHVETGDATLSIAETGTILADRSRLLTVLENLVRNSIDHAGDDIAVTVGLTADGFFYRDDGPGIPEDDRERIFEYGYTTDRDGTGLGLNIVETMVDAHGWSIALATDYEDGAGFVVEDATTRLEAAGTSLEEGSRA